MLSPEETAVTDRGYQSHNDFDQLQAAGKHFVSRIDQAHWPAPQSGTKPLPEGTTWIYPEKRAGCGSSEAPGSAIIAQVNKLRWDIETFFAWWKRHLKVYLLISRSRHGLMIQKLAGLITSLLLTIYCYEQHGESVSIRRVRQLQHQILTEAKMLLSQVVVLPDEAILETLHASP